MGQIIQRSLPVVKKYTDDFLKCQSCQRGNNFLIDVKKEGDQYFYLTQCPKCKSYDEVRRITAKEASRYLSALTPDDLLQ